MASKTTFGTKTCDEVLSDLLDDIYKLSQEGAIDGETFVKVTGAYAATKILPFRKTSDIDVIVSDAPLIQELLVNRFPTKYFLQNDLTESILYRGVGTHGAQASFPFPIDLVRLSSMPQGHPVTSSMISIRRMKEVRGAYYQGFSDLLDLIVLKIGAVVSDSRNPKKIPQDERDLKKLVICNNDKMRHSARLLNAGDLSGQDLHAKYFFCYYDHPKVGRIGDILRSWLYLSPGNTPSLLDPEGNVVLQYADRERLRDKWESEDCNDDSDEDM